MTPRELFAEQSKKSKQSREPVQQTASPRIRSDRDPLNLPNPTLKPTKDLLARLQGFLLGKLTWAQVEGWNPEDLYAYATVGSQLFRAGRIAQAKSVFEACEAINPKDWYFSYCLGQIEILQGNRQAAIDSFRRSTQSPLKRPEPHLLLAGCLLQEGKQDEAMREIKQAKLIAERIQQENPTS